MLAAIRAARPAARLARSAVKTSAVARTISTTSVRLSDHPVAPPVFGTGAKPGEVPTDENQSTGLERVQIYGNLQGIHVFDNEPLDASRLGTLKDPIKVPSPVRKCLNKHAPYIFSPKKMRLASRPYHRLHGLPCGVARHSLVGAGGWHNRSLP